MLRNEIKQFLSKKRKSIYYCENVKNSKTMGVEDVTKEMLKCCLLMK